MKELFEAMSGLKDNRNGKVVTFDFDHTIVKSFLNKTVDGEEQYMFGGVNKEIIKRIKRFKESGTTVFVVTSRRNDLEHGDSSVKALLSELGLEVDAVFYTNEEPKAQKLYELGSRLHYDDDPAEHEAINAFKNLHKDFEIEVKYPDDLIKDIEAVAKGVIITSDHKLIMAQRSDSYEWDAPGGHLQDGEEANYAFWREVKEELGLEVNEVQFLDNITTTWRGVDKDTYYFFGRIDYSSDELEGIIDLQWEVSDYLCGDWEELMRKSKGNATQHLENVLQLIETQQELIESYQPHSKNHKTKKRRIVGLGGSKTTGAKGLKRVSDFSRAKSAPPGFGVLEEEKYSEEGSFTHDGKEYDISKAFSIANAKEKRDFKVSELKWVLKYDKVDPTRKTDSDLSAPIMVAMSVNGKLAVVDGLHRLAKAVESGKTSLTGVLLTAGDLKKIEKPTKKFKIKINSRPRAAIIKGNPEFRAQKGDVADKFYKEIENFVKKNGFVVDSFEPKSRWYPGTPKKMVYNIWIGHSLGSDRLEGAVEEGYTQKAIGFGVPNAKDQPFPAINSPRDVDWSNSDAHYEFTDEMKASLQKMLNDIKQLDEKKRKKKKKTTKRKGSSKGKSKKRKGSSWGIYGGTYFDWGLYDGSDGGGDGGGGE